MRIVISFLLIVSIFVGASFLFIDDFFSDYFAEFRNLTVVEKSIWTLTVLSFLGFGGVLGSFPYVRQKHRLVLELTLAKERIRDFKHLHSSLTEEIAELSLFVSDRIIKRATNLITSSEDVQIQNANVLVNNGLENIINGLEELTYFSQRTFSTELPDELKDRLRKILGTDTESKDLRVGKGNFMFSTPEILINDLEISADKTARHAGQILEETNDFAKAFPHFEDAFSQLKVLGLIYKKAHFSTLTNYINSMACARGPESVLPELNVHINELLKRYGEKDDCVIYLQYSRVHMLRAAGLQDNAAEFLEELFRQGHRHRFIEMVSEYDVSELESSLGVSPPEQ